MLKLIITIILGLIAPMDLIAQDSAGEINQAAKEYELANVAYAKNLPEEAYTHLQKAAELDPNNSPYLNSAGFMAFQFNELDKATNYLEKALALDKAYYGEAHPAIASLLNNLGSVWDKKGDKVKALSYLNQALTIVTNDLGDTHPRTQSIRQRRDELAAKSN